MGRTLMIGVVISLGVACGGDDIEATPAGVVLELDAAALGAEGAPGDEAITRQVRCGVRDLREEEEGFAVDVESVVRPDPDGEQLVELRLTVTESECAVDASLQGEPQYDGVGSDRHGRAQVQLSYRCPDFSGSGVVDVPTDGLPSSASAGFDCNLLR